jgi:hypothetical protein
VGFRIFSDAGSSWQRDAATHPRDARATRTNPAKPLIHGSCSAPAADRFQAAPSRPNSGHRHWRDVKNATIKILRIQPSNGILDQLHGNQDPENSQISLESAQAVCCGCVPPDGEIAPEQLYDLRELQIQNLETWARSRNGIISRDTLPVLQERTNEHLVGFRESDNRWVKLTKPRRFGFIADTEFALNSQTQTPARRACYPRPSRTNSKKDKLDRINRMNRMNRMG